MNVKFAVQVELAEMNCGECGGVYAINERYREQQYKKGGTWTCPYCKTGWGYSGNSENEKLKRELEAERKRKLEALDRANAAMFERDMAQKDLKRHLVRSKNGVCPCCKRTFKQLAAHMKTKHPEFKP